MEMHETTCEKCAFYLQLAPGSGECRRYAAHPSPSVYVTRAEATGTYKTDVHWPKVYDSNWCGDFKAKH